MPFVNERCMNNWYVLNTAGLDILMPLTCTIDNENISSLLNKSIGKLGKSTSLMKAMFVKALAQTPHISKLSEAIPGPFVTRISRSKSF